MTRMNDLGPLEMRVLGLLEANEALGVAEVRARLASGGHEAAYTTVMTVLARLFDKGMVAREKEGRRYLYRPAHGAPAEKGRILQRVQRALFQDDRLRPIAALLDDERLTHEELEELRDLIDARLEEER